MFFSNKNASLKKIAMKKNPMVKFLDKKNYTRIKLKIIII